MIIYSVVFGSAAEIQRPGTRHVMLQFSSTLVLASTHPLQQGQWLTSVKLFFFLRIVHASLYFTSKSLGDILWELNFIFFPKPFAPFQKKKT